jgi:HD-GYP domain-containing protein (c-di-GMP phosphodiesterase class II)
MHHHPNVGFEVVRRMPGWEEAANAIKQHHEYFDGSGYPQQLKGSETTNGAQILAICDAFFSLTHERADRYQPRSLIRAMAEINACSGSQFCPFWVEIFNVVVKIQQMAGQL